MAVETVPAWARDRWETKTFLLDRGFRAAAKLLDDAPATIVEQLLSACFSIQKYRDTARNQKRPVLFTKIRTELDMDRAEFARAIMAFQAEDMLARHKDWRERLDGYAETQIEPGQVAFLRKIKAHYPDWIEQQFERRNPKPQPIKVQPGDIGSIENNRPGREDWSSNFVELVERYFTHICGVKLSWEELTSELGTRDPRAKKAESLRTKAKKAAAQKETDTSDKVLSEPPIEQIVPADADPPQIAMEA